MATCTLEIVITKGKLSKVMWLELFKSSGQLRTCGWNSCLVQLHGCSFSAVREATVLCVSIACSSALYIFGTVYPVHC